MYTPTMSLMQVINKIEVQIRKRTIMLPISTRSCGFIIRTLVSRFRNWNVLNDDDYYPLTNALYRITLLQIDYKLEEAIKLQKYGNYMDESFDDTYLKKYQRRKLDLMGIGFAPLVNYISAIGYVEYGDGYFLPRHPKLKINTCCPYYVRNSNLRSIVEYLSSETSDNDIKRKFMLNCPIPGAQWITETTKGKQDITMLLNPDDIVPGNYTADHLRDDITTVRAAINRVCRKYPLYVSSKRIDWTAQGLITQLVSTKGAKVCCPSYKLTGQIPFIKGESTLYWTREKLSDQEAYMGVVHMLGEHETESLANPISCCYRGENCGSHTFHLDYCSAVMNIFARLLIV